VTDGVSFLWRWELAGHAREIDAWRALHDFAESAFPRAPSRGGNALAICEYRSARAGIQGKRLAMAPGPPREPPRGGLALAGRPGNPQGRRPRDETRSEIV
jgi:hypothetical protein